MAKPRCVERKADSKGRVYARVADPDGTWRILRLCENYNGKVHGGIKKTWRYVAKGLSRDDAISLFDRRTK